MLINFLTESQVKNIEYAIIKNNLCTSMEDINNTLEKDFKKNKKLIEYFKQKHDISKKEESFPVKKKYNKYNY
jgi:hypothetical protein